MDREAERLCALFGVLVFDAPEAGRRSGWGTFRWEGERRSGIILREGEAGGRRQFTIAYLLGCILKCRTDYRLPADTHSVVWCNRFAEAVTGLNEDAAHKEAA